MLCLSPTVSGDLTALDLRMLSSRAPLWTLPRAHHGSAVTSLSCWASGTATAPTTRIKLAAPDSLQKTPGATAGSSGGGAAAAAVPLQQLLVSGAKDGSVFVVDVQSGKAVDVMDRVHFTASKVSMAGLRMLSGCECYIIVLPIKMREQHKVGVIRRPVPL